MSPLAPAPTPRFYGALESLRGICALFIVFIHFPWRSAFGQVPAFAQSWLFVDQFFVLSGFVIAHVYLAQLDSLADARVFAIKRFFRLYPLHLFAWVCASGLIVGRWLLNIKPPSTEFNLTNNLLGLTLTHGLGFVEALPVNTPSWSISTEMAAYLLFAIVCLSTRHRVIVMGLASAIALIVLVVFNGATLEGDLTFRVFRCFYSFGLGVLAWRFARPAPWMQLVALVVLAALLWLSAIDTRFTLLFPVAAAVLVAALSCDGPLARLLNRRPFLALGRWSYSIYLMHSVVLTLIGFVLNRVVSARYGTIPVLPLGYDLALEVATACIVVLVASQTYRFVEEPGRAYARHLLARRRAPIDEPPTGKPALLGVGGAHAHRPFR